jgi:hypothetical protein
LFEDIALNHDMRNTTDKPAAIVAQLLARINYPPAFFTEEYIWEAVFSTAGMEKALCQLAKVHFLIEVSGKNVRRAISHSFAHMSDDFIVCPTPLFSDEVGVRFHAPTTFTKADSVLYICHMRRHCTVPVTKDQHSRICSLEQGQGNDGLWRVSNLRLALLTEYMTCLYCVAGKCTPEKCWASTKKFDLDALYKSWT